MWTKHPRVAVLAAIVLLPSIAGLAAHREAAAHASRAPKVIAISSVFGRIVDDSGVRERMKGLDSLIDSTVRAQGFGVVSRDVVDTLERRLRDSLGGAFDPVTGKRDSARAQEVERLVTHAMVTRLGADAWLQPFLAVEGVPFYGGEAKWRGTKEKTGAPGGVGGVLFGTKSGRIPALSLAVLVEDSAAKAIYRGGGGIQLLMKANGATKKPADVPADQLLVDRARMEHAVRFALDSLAAEVGLERAEVPKGDR